MICIQETELRELIRESYIKTLSEGRNYDREISSSILALKDTLRKKNFVCNTQYVAPKPEKRHRDFGYCTIKIDTTMGRGKSMSPRAIKKLIERTCEKLGLNKYFSMADSGFDGRYCDCGLRLKPKYVTKYMENSTNIV